MQKKILLSILSIIFFIFYHSSVLSEEVKIIPIKKPLLSESELKKKILINILKPLPKPKKEIKQDTDIQVTKKEIKQPNYSIPKKKPIITGKDKSSKIVKSKFYSKKDFTIAKKAISEMKKSNWTVAINTAKKAKDNNL